MSTLFITATWPHPLHAFTHGVAQRMRLMLRALQQVEGDIDMLAYVPWNSRVEEDTSERIRNDLASLWGVRVRKVYLAPSVAVGDRPRSLWHGYVKPVLGLRFQPSYAPLSGRAPARALEAVVADCCPDRLFVHKLLAMSPVLECQASLPPVAFDLDDVEHKAFARLIALPPHWRAKNLMKAWLPALRRGERRALQHAQIAFVCSDMDKDYLTQLWQLENVQAVPNALPVPAPSALPEEKTAVFLGLQSYEPNRAGAEFLIEQIWPLVLRQHPDARLVIAGKGCELIRGYDRPPPGVEFAGYVSSLADLYSRSRVVCCPLLSGGGTRIKIIEGALQGRPVVSTTIGAEGLDFSAGRGEISIADTPTRFADELAGLLCNTQAATEMARRARMQAIARYSEEKVMELISARLREAGW